MKNRTLTLTKYLVGLFWLLFILSSCENEEFVDEKYKANLPDQWYLIDVDQIKDNQMTKEMKDLSHAFPDKSFYYISIKVEDNQKSNYHEILCYDHWHLIYFKPYPEEQVVTGIAEYSSDGFSSEERKEIINYFVNKYGKKNPRSRLKMDH